VIQRGFWGAVAFIELVDLSLGVGNVVAAVALSDKTWVVCADAFIGILVPRAPEALANAGGAVEAASVRLPPDVSLARWSNRRRSTASRWRCGWRTGSCRTRRELRGCPATEMIPAIRAWAAALDKEDPRNEHPLCEASPPPGWTTRVAPRPCWRL